MSGVFLEIVFDAHALAEAGFDGRDELEEPLEEALEESGLGEVTGGGSGSGVAIIDVEITDETRFDAALAVIRRTLRSLNAPRGTKLIRRGPGAAEFPLDG